jgi:hypothetical protein
MVFVVRYNDEEKEFDDPHEANMFAMETGLGFPDVIIIERRKKMSENNLKDAIEETCSKVLKDMNMTEEQMIAASARLTEWLLSEKSKNTLGTVKELAKKGLPGNINTAYLAEIYHQIFMLGYQCGMADEQRKR